MMSLQARSRFLLHWLCAFTLAFTALSSQAEVRPIDQIIAVVDEDVVLLSELKERYFSVKRQLQQRGAKLPPDNILQQQVLERLVIESLQLQRGKRAGVRINDAQLNDAMANIAAQNGLSLDQFVQGLQTDGISYRSVRDQIRKEMIINRVQQGVVNNRIQITDQEIDNFLKSEVGKETTAADYRLLHILVPAAPGKQAQQQAQVLADDIYQQLLQGADFSTLAVTHSAGQNALNGGDLGWRKASQLPTMFAEKAEKLEIGAVSTPLRSGSGFHILKLVNKRGGSGQMVDQVHSRHILLKPNEIRTNDQAKAQITQIREQIVAGTTPFAELAKEHSEDMGSALSGGDLGWMQPSQLVPEYREVMKTIEIGTVSEPFQTQFGWHILEVIERRQEDMSEEFVRDRARQIIHRRKYDEELYSWLREIRDQAFVDIKQ